MNNVLLWWKIWTLKKKSSFLCGWQLALSRSANLKTTMKFFFFQISSEAKNLRVKQTARKVSNSTLLFDFAP